MEAVMFQHILSAPNRCLHDVNVLQNLRECAFLNIYPIRVTQQGYTSGAWKHRCQSSATKHCIEMFIPTGLNLSLENLEKYEIDLQ